MRTTYRNLTGLATFSLMLPAAADVIYSGLQNIAIPTNFTGVSVTVDGGTINPFFGGVGVANDALCQPVRAGTGGLDTILNLSAGSAIDASSLYFATGDGGSSAHLGSTFTAGTEGYLGMKLKGADYGWMRVVFTNNTGGAVIKDWAYDNSGSGIVAGNVLQSAPAGGAQTVTLTSSTGRSLTMGTRITDDLGHNGVNYTNSVVKEGGGVAVLTGDNTYTGTTTVANGTLLVNGGISGGGDVNVSGGTLGGTGNISGGVTIWATGTLAPTPQQANGGRLTLGGTVALTGSPIFEWDLTTPTTTDPGILEDCGAYGQMLVGGAVSGTAVFTVTLLGGATGTTNYADSFWDTNKSWNNVFVAPDLTDLSTVFTSFGGPGLTNSGSGASAVATADGQGYFKFTGNSLNWVAVPEPSGTVAWVLLCSGLLRWARKR